MNIFVYKNVLLLKYPGIFGWEEILSFEHSVFLRLICLTFDVYDYIYCSHDVLFFISRKGMIINCFCLFCNLVMFYFCHIYIAMCIYVIVFDMCKDIYVFILPVYIFSTYGRFINIHPFLKCLSTGFCFFALFSTVVSLTPM